MRRKVSLVTTTRSTVDCAHSFACARRGSGRRMIATTLGYPGEYLKFRRSRRIQEPDAYMRWHTTNAYGRAIDMASYFPSVDCDKWNDWRGLTW